MPSLAVIIAAREAAPWIGDCVASVASQQLPAGWRLQIMVGVDACAPTLARARMLDPPNLQLYMFNARVGPYIVFNTLAHLAHDNLLARFDADDVMLPGYLYAQIAQMRGRTEPAISQTWSAYTDAALKPIRAPLANGSTTRADGKRDAPSDGQFMMPQSVIGLLGGFRPWLCHADTEFLTRARLLGIHFNVCEAHLYLRRVHAASLTNAPHSDYRSQLRQQYAHHVAATKAHFLKSRAVERVTPVMAPCVRIPAHGARWARRPPTLPERAC
jgi:hypothetical protein